MVAMMQFDRMNRCCKRTCLCSGMITNIGGTARHHELCLIFFVCVMFPALCSSELVVRENDGDGFGAMWRINSFNLDPIGANVCNTTSLRLATSLLGPDEVTSMCNSIYSPATCHALRSGIIGTDELYLPLVNYTCCKGFQREANTCPNVCSIDTYGQDCSLSCNCRNGGTCNPENGTCQCRPGWRGPHCEFTCPTDRYGDGCESVCDCQNGGSCQRETGSCLCALGFTGSRCEDDCPTLGSPAPGCNDDYHCERCGHVRQQACDVPLGHCLCADGWQGRFCNHTCQGSTHGRNCNDQCDCVNAADCWPVDGRCECRPGWTGERCDKECPAGSFGEQCRRSCSCPEGAVCDHEHGGCDCPAGWKGQGCASPCVADKWDAGCTQDCSCSDDQDCEPIRGRCFNPADYQDGTPNTSSNPNTVIIIAASVGAVVAVIAIVIAIVTLICRKKRPPQNLVPSLSNGVQNGSARSHENGRYSGPSPPPRDPSTLLPSRNPSERDLHRYESIPETHRPHSYLEVYEETGQIDNPLFDPGSTGYEIPTPTGTLERGIDSQQNPGQSRDRIANPLYGGNTGYEIPTPTLERGIDSRQNPGQSRGRIANPLYGGNTGYEIPTPPGTLERGLDGSRDDGEYTYLTVPPRANTDYAEPTM